MSSSSSMVRGLVAALSALAAPVGACADDPGTPAPACTAVAEDVAIARGVAFFAQPPSQEPFALLMLDVIHRGFGVPAFADAAARYDAEIAARPEDAAVLRVFRRLVTPDAVASPTDLAAITTAIDRLTAPALYCDQLPTPADYPAQLAAAVEEGGYALTHALLAWLWLRDNGCDPGLTAGFVAATVDRVAALIDPSDATLSDLEIEAAALLHAAGHGHRVPAALVVEVSALLRDATDGVDDPDPAKEWHPMVLALWLLLQDACPADPPPPMLAR